MKAMHDNKTTVCNLLVSKNNCNDVQRAYFEWVRNLYPSNVSVVSQLPESAGELSDHAIVDGIKLSQVPEAFLLKLNDLCIPYKQI